MCRYKDYKIFPNIATEFQDQNAAALDMVDQPRKALVNKQLTDEQKGDESELV